MPLVQTHDARLSKGHARQSARSRTLYVRALGRSDYRKSSSSLCTAIGVRFFARPSVGTVFTFLDSTAGSAAAVGVDPSWMIRVSALAALLSSTISSLAREFVWTHEPPYHLGVLSSIASTELEHARSGSGSSRVAAGMHSGSSVSTTDDMTAPFASRHSN